MPFRIFGHPGSARVGAVVTALTLMGGLGLAGCGQSQPTASTPAAADKAASGTPPKGATWDEIAQFPDWTGTWLVATIPSPVSTTEELSLTPEYAAKLAAARAKAKSGGKIEVALNECEPNGVPTVMNEKDMQYQFLFTPGRLTIVPEDNQVRRIYTTKDAHPDDPDLTYGGDSIAHWEGQTLVVDTVGILPHLPLAEGFVGAGDMHVVERMALKDENTLQIDTTITDSALTKPYSYSLVYTRHRDMPMQEKLCVPKGYSAP